MSEGDKRYRECVAEITGVLKKYDMGGAITVVDKERAMFLYEFPTWSCISIKDGAVRFRLKTSEFPSKQAAQQAAELSTHIILQMRDIAAQTFTMCEHIHQKLKKNWDIEHKPFADFDPERTQ